MDEIERIELVMTKGEHTDGDLAFAVEQWKAALLKLGAVTQMALSYEKENEALESRLSTALNLLERVKKDLLDRGSMDTGDHVVVVNLSSTLWNSLCDFLVEKHAPIASGTSEQYSCEQGWHVWTEGAIIKTCRHCGVQSE